MNDAAPRTAPDPLQSLLDSNAHWARATAARDPFLFRRLSAPHTPRYLWIGCSDPQLQTASEVVGLAPGELFVHRNFGNIVSRADLSGQSALQFAIDSLGVEHIVVVGHYGCSAVASALSAAADSPLAEQWLGHIRAVAERHQRVLDAEAVLAAKAALLCELNVIEQAINLCSSAAVLSAWRRQRPLTVHAWIYRPEDGRLRTLGLCVNAEGSTAELRADVVGRLLRGRAGATPAPRRPAPACCADDRGMPVGTAIEPLTDREVEVFTALSNGDSNALIAHRLQISPNTVASHLRNIYQKIGTSSRVQAVLTARAMKESGRLGRAAAPAG